MTPPIFFLIFSNLYSIIQIPYTLSVSPRYVNLRSSGSKVKDLDFIVDLLGVFTVLFWVKRS